MNVYLCSRCAARVTEDAQDMVRRPSSNHGFLLRMPEGRRGSFRVRTSD